MESEVNSNADKSSIDNCDVLAAPVIRGQKKLLEHPLLTPADRQQLLATWNGTAINYPQEACLHLLVEQQVARTPDRVALVFDDQQLTYRELNTHGNQLAHYLQQRGIGPEVSVGICVERSMDLVIALLGVLKAGGVYVPLDPGYPQDRLAFMLADAQVPILLTQQRLVGKLPEHGAHVACLDTDWETIASFSGQNTSSHVTAGNLAYIIYTSGSTGIPKGTMITHRGICNRILYGQEVYPLTVADTLLQRTSTSFDASICEIFWPLIAGARLTLPRPERVRDFTYLVNLIARHKVTVVVFVPSLLQIFLEEYGLETCDQLRCVICGGEALSAELQERFFARLNADLRNHYGPTEASIDTTFWACKRGWDGQTIPIGRPIANMQVYILDAYLNPVPIGVPGELYISGIGLARGYLNRPGLTAEKFTPNPFSDEPGARFYKTGDRTRSLPGGDIEFLGRSDHQVKIRGFRIELEEIEIVLQRYSEVREAVVVVREDTPGMERLVAYVVPRTRATLTAGGMRDFLRAKLPEYMVPSAFVPLEALPLTPSGKLDRRALPAPATAPSQREDNFVAPRTPIEEVLVAIWSDVLRVKRVSIHDNFFELGGHSLSATQVISRVATIFQVELTLRHVFETPCIADLARYIETVSATAHHLGESPIQPIPRDGNLPLSFAQQRLWFLDQLVPDNCFYNMPTVIRLAGQLKMSAFEFSLNALVQRHEALRTTFVAMEGRPIQVIAPSVTVTVPVLDLRSLSEVTREDEARRLVIEVIRRPFDLTQGPLLRTILLNLDADEHLFVLVLHHIVSDGWSMGVLFRELGVLYDAFLHGKPLPLLDLPIQYADYACWQHQQLQGTLLEMQLAYWRAQLKNASSILELPTDRPRPSVQTFHGATLSVVLPESLSDLLKALSQEEKSTIFMTLLTVFKILLYRYTGCMDIIVGSPIANRNRGEIEGLVGFFVNTLVLRTDLSGNPSFRELLRRMRKVALEAYAHQDLPFEKLVEELQPERDLSRQPLVQVLFVLQNAPMTPLKLAGLTLNRLEFDLGIAQFDLALSMEVMEQGLIGVFEYNTDLFDTATIGRMRKHFLTLLESIATHPEQQLADISILTQTELQQLLVEWNQTQVEYHRDVCIHELFEAQVGRMPDAVALVFEDKQLTYCELNRRANRLAYYLRSLGVQPDVVVGICAERSIEMVVGILGVLKAGGAYMPLDPTYPRERVRLILEDSHISVLLTQQQVAIRLPIHSVQIIYLDREWDFNNEWGEKNLSIQIGPQNLAYVIYTSGSTGRPKGVMITHRAIANHMGWMAAAFPLDAADRVLQKTPIGFDASVWEFYAPLLAGAQLVLAQQGGHRDSTYLVDTILTHQITVLQLVPTLLQMLLEEPLFEACRSLRRLFCGGEELTADLAQRLWARLDVALYNLYGPTEAAIDVSSWPCQPRETQHSMPIGRPVANTQLYVLDPVLRPVPIGVLGELYIGGVQLARGYLGRPDLTAEKFIPNLFSDEPGARLYKTGDLARYLPDGNIEFLGRVDHQIKMRGFRIELGEIEMVLRTHPALRETIVMLREDISGIKRLVAYIVPYPTTTLTISDLQTVLKAKLPEYMMPAAFVLLNALPLTPNGKFDRQALPAPDATRSEQQGEAFVAPRTPAEEVLALIWADILRLPRVGVHDNFFELGGDSILSIQIIAKANQAGLRLIPRQIFQYQTIAELAIVAHMVSAEHAPQGLVSGLVPLTPIQRWFFEQNFVSLHHWNQAMLLEVQQPLEPIFLERAIKELLLYHDVLRLRFTREETGWQQIHAPPDPKVPFSRIDLSSLSEEEQWAAMKASASEMQASLELSEGPLVRVALFDLGLHKSGCLLIIIHHLVVDGVSWRILLGDLQLVYQQLSRGEIIQLPLKTTPFKQWAERLMKYAQSVGLRQELDYWKAISQAQICDLPVDYQYSKKAQTLTSVRTVSVTLSSEETSKLLYEVPKKYRTEINDVLLTALTQSFVPWMGTRMLLVDLEGHGREDIYEDVDLSRTVGWFTSIFPVTLQIKETENIGGDLKSIKEQLRAIPNHGIGYGLLRYLCEDANVIKELCSLPQAQIAFNYLGQFDQVFSDASPFKLIRGSVGVTRNLTEKIHYLIEINGMIIRNQLQFDWMYSDQVHRQSTIQELAKRFVDALRALIDHCLSVNQGGFIPSDFPLANLDEHKLSKLSALLDEADGDQ